MPFVCSDDAIRLQIRQVERWLKAARQDLDPGVKFLHASYGVGNLDILRQIVTDQEIQRIGGVNPVALLQELSALQDAAARRV